MPRQLRRRFPGAKYHVMNRGDGRQRIFYGQDDRERFLEQMVYALEADSVRLYAYCLMPNHFHLFIETPHANIDEFMGRLATAYGLYFRYKRNRPGHCFQGRYKAPLVEGDDYILRLTRYIHLNPVQTPSTEKLSDEEKWRVLDAHKWSSLGGYLSVEQREDHVDYRWLAGFGSRRERGERYRMYMAKMLNKEDPILGEAMDSSAYAIGDEAFREEVAEWVRDQRATVGVDAAVPVREGVDVEQVARAVAEEFGIEAAQLHVARSRLGFARGVFIELACRLSFLNQRQVAGYLGNVTEHGVGKARNKLRRHLQEDSILARRLKRIETKLKAKV